MRAYKLFRKRKDGSYGPLFINRTQRVPCGEWLDAENHPTKGYAIRPGWHCSKYPYAPHLAMHEDRVWCEVEIEQWYRFPRPKKQGGEWLIAMKMKVIGEIDHTKYKEKIL